MLSHLASVSIFGVASGDFENGSPSPTNFFSTFPVSSYRHPLRLHFYFIFICTPDFGAPSLFRASVPPSGWLSKGGVGGGGGGGGRYRIPTAHSPIGLSPPPCSWRSNCVYSTYVWMEGDRVGCPYPPIGSLTALQLSVKLLCCEKLT